MLSDTTKDDSDSLDLTLSNEYEPLSEESDGIGSIVSIHRQQKCMTVIGKHPISNNKISISLSQERIVKCNSSPSTASIKRSQSINIENTVQVPANKIRRNQSIDLSNTSLSSRRPSQIPLKIPDHTKLSLPMKSKPSASEKPTRNVFSISNCKIPRKWSVPNVSQDKDTTKLLPPDLSLRNIKTEPIISEPFSLPARLQGHFSRDIRNVLPAAYKCGICSNPFIDPRVLNCLHTFCLECLFDLEEHTKQVKVNAIIGTNSRENSEFDFSGLCFNSE